MSYIYHQVTILVYEILIKNMYYQHTTKEWNNYDIVNNYNIVNNHNIVTKYMDKLIHLSKGLEEQDDNVKLQMW